MTTKPAHKFIGKYANLHGERGLKFLIVILEHREVFGRDDFLVAPVSGSGERWVSLDSLSDFTDPEPEQKTTEVKAA